MRGRTSAAPEAAPASTPLRGALVLAEAAPASTPLRGALVLVLASACSADPIQIEGQYGRPLPLGSGDGSPLPRLAFVDEGCAGELAAGGCEASGEGACQMLLVDSLAPLTTLRDPEATGSRLSVECLEVRPAAGLFAPEPGEEALEAAVARFRFDGLPLVRAPEGDGWTWTAGNQQRTIEPAGVLGGNLLRNLAVAIRTPGPDDGELPSVTLYGEFPGSESILADQGRAFLPVQFPGRLLGRDLSDRCEVDEGRCELDGFDVSTSAAEPALVASRMVMDACIAIPPCTLRYVPSIDDPFGPPETCNLYRGPTSNTGCVEPTDPEHGGLPASLVVATGVPGLVLFSDSAARMFGDLAELTPCPTPLSPQTQTAGDIRACFIGNDGVLHFAGWPSAGDEEGGPRLPRLRIRSLALVPGAAQSRAEGPCERADDRRDAMHGQCYRYILRANETGDIRDTSPPYSAQRDDDDGEGHFGDPAASALAVLGEPMLEEGATGPRPSRWITATVLPADHPLALAVRRDVAPDAVEPDGLLGTALFSGTETVLDYTDPNPALRITCLEPHEGRCQVLPDCRVDRTAACCHGLPRTMLDELIRTLGDDTCCGALSAEDLAELSQAGHCVGVAAP